MYRPITRPRMSGAEPSWTVELAAVFRVSRMSPVGTSMARNSQNEGISAVTTSSRPNANAAVTSSRSPGLLRRAASSAPASAPAANTAEATPNAVAPVWNTCRDMSALVTWKFIPKVATKKISTIGISSCGPGPHVGEALAELAPAAGAPAPPACSSPGRISLRLVSTAP